MKWVGFGLLILLGVVVLRSIPVNRTSSPTVIQYVDDRGNPISKERAEAWLKARDEGRAKWDKVVEEARGSDSSKTPGEIYRDGMYGAQMIRCANMNDLELQMNEGLCREAMRRVDQATGR